eukprot:CAMPEP_0179089828 /NCGR_PEP_ID=MMETSP0796-20121207/40950_1 /TAXON_ID=73915 /ORGANISM="Pyrodinium bahamense, Strain pbaha01" /LENGTH=65 /DNA_ID=CAMNT_0020787389 /DNA_START=58 /DNA_END=251 /DNA_ORIENTATION=+
MASTIVALVRMVLILVVLCSLVPPSSGETSTDAPEAVHGAATTKSAATIGAQVNVATPVLRGEST